MAAGHGHGKDEFKEISRKEINGRTYRVMYNVYLGTYTVYKDIAGKNEELVQHKMNGHELASCLLKIAEDEVIAAFKMVAE